MYPKEGFYQYPFPLFPVDGTEAFSFKKEFGKIKGRLISNDLEATLNSADASSDENLVYSIPISLSIFNKHKHSKIGEHLVKQTLLTSVQGIAWRVSEEQPVTATSRFTEDLSPLTLYSSAFGDDIPLSDDQRKKMLEISKEAILGEGIKVKDATLKVAEFIHNYLALGGEAFWSEDFISEVLEEVKFELVSNWLAYRSASRLNPKYFSKNFSKIAFLYTSLRKLL